MFEFSPPGVAHRVQLRILSTIAVAALLLLFAGGPAAAQTFFGSIGGAVADATGAAIPAAPVTLRESATNVQRTGVTNAEGNYNFPNLPPGTYLVTVTAAGFKEAKSASIRLAAQQVYRFDLKLEVGDTKSTIEVAAESSSMNYETARISDVRPREQILSMPVNSRSTLPQLYMTSFVYDGDLIGGVRNNNVNYTVDGVTSNSVNFGGRVGNMIEVSLDAVQEVNVLASNNSAEFPRAATMAVITRSGTNQLHGTAFYEHSNNIFNAAPFNHLKAKGPTRHEYGGSVGGPVYVPKVFDGRNRTFFFFNWEHTKPPGLSDWSASVPTLKMRSGDFSELLASGTIVKDYTTGAPFPNNVIPAPRFNSVSQKILTYNDYIPKPNYGPDNNFVQNYRILLPPGWWDDRYMVRGDQNIGNKDSLSGRLTLRKSPAVYPESAIQAFTREQYRGVANLYVSESHTFTPAIVNEFRFGYSRDYSHVKGNVLGAQVIKDWGIQGINLSNKQDLRGVPNVTFLNFASIYDSATYFWRGQTYEFLDNLSLTRGSHMIRTGFMLRKNLSDVTDKNTTADFGSYGFSRFATGFDFSDFLLGVPQATTRVERAPERNLRFAELGVYVNDDWRISKTLTLNLGLRYDYGVPPVERNDQRYAFNAATGQVVVPTAAALGRISPYYPKNIPIVTAAQAGYPERSLVKGDKNNFGPRIGFAWRPVPKTVIRGGYGFYYTNLVYTLIDRFSGGPFGGRETYDNVIENGQPRFQFPNPFLPAGRLPSQSMSGVVVNPQAANMQMWNLTVEREVGSGFVGRVSYRGFRTTQLGYEGNINKPMASADPNGGNWYRFNWFSSAYLFQTGAIQKMNALDVGVERRFQKGLVLQSGWTWAKDLTDAAGGLDGGVIEDPYNRRREMSNVPGVPRHRWVTSSVWEVPFGTGQRYGASAHPIIRQTVGNWSLSGITAFQTGNPLTPDFSGPDPSNTRQFGGRPDWVSDWKLSNPTVYQWYNPAAFAVPPNGRYGNAAPNIVFGPGLANFNFGVFKYFSLWEKGRLQFRMTATNFLNHPNYGDPNMSISSASAGRITGLRGNGDTSLGGGTRMIRMGLRLEF